jgi:hypothetical protein
VSTICDVISGKIKGSKLEYRFYTECFEPGFVYLRLTHKQGCKKCGINYKDETIRLPIEVYQAICGEKVIKTVEENNHYAKVETKCKKK